MNRLLLHIALSCDVPYRCMGIHGLLRSSGYAIEPGLISAFAMRLYKIKLLLQNRKSPDSIILFILYADNGTLIVQSRTRLHTKIVRDYLKLITRLVHKNFNIRITNVQGLTIKRSRLRKLLWHTAALNIGLFSNRYRVFLLV